MNDVPTFVMEGKQAVAIKNKYCCVNDECARHRKTTYQIIDLHLSEEVNEVL